MAKSGNTKLHALPAQSTEELFELKQKIRIHRIKILLLILAVVSIVVGFIFAAYFYFERKTYTGYELVEQMEQGDMQTAEFEEFEGNILQYTQDGAVYFDMSGNVIWNQTYEMETPCVTMCKDYLAIYEQGGSRIFIMDVAGRQGTIKATMPIQRVSIAGQGTVAVLMEDSGTSYIHMYSKDGSRLAEGGLHIENSGYPLDLALSADAQKLAVSMLDISEGNVQSAIVFYNYGTVGQNEIDNIVGSYAYPDMMIPSIKFVSNDRLLAFGDTKVIIYEGKQKPAVAQEIKCTDVVRSVYYNERYFGLTYDNPKSAKGYHTVIYNMHGKTVLEQDLGLDYTEIGFLQNGLLCVRNEKSVVLYTVRGNKRFEHTFDRNIYDVISGSDQLEYLFVLSGETDLVRLSDE